jgi:hypothetical protein
VGENSFTFFILSIKNLQKQDFCVLLVQKKFPSGSESMYVAHLDETAGRQVGQIQPGWPAAHLKNQIKSKSKSFISLNRYHTYFIFVSDKNT